jgi:hypothetical protein
MAKEKWLGAGRADAEKLEFVVEVFVARFFADFFFQMMHRAGGFDRLDTTTFGANQVILMATGQQQGEIRCTLM